MAIDLSDGYIYFIESDGGDNDDWIGDHAGDPDALDLTNYTEGTEYCKLEFPKRWKKIFNTGMNIYPSGGGVSFQLRPNRRFYQLLSQGIETSRANGDLVEGFFTINRHTASSATTYKDYYVIVRFGASDYVKFTDADGNRKEYCKGAVTGGDVTWTENNPANVIISLSFDSIWG